MNFFLVAVGVIFVAVLANLGCAQIPSAGRAEDAARNLGMHNPRVVSRAPAWGVLGGCHEDDVTKFTVTDGQRTITVCAPILGGYTVRS